MLWEAIRRPVVDETTDSNIQRSQQYPMSKHLQPDRMRQTLGHVEADSILVIVFELRID
jgi:hypothetical protein